MMVGCIFILSFRLAGYENSLLGYRPRIYSTIKSLLKEDKNAIDVLMFGEEIKVHRAMSHSVNS